MMTFVTLVKVDQVGLANIQRVVCLYVCMYEAAGVRPHTPLVNTSLPSSPLQWGRSDDPGSSSPLVLPLLTPPVTSWSTTGVSAVLQTLFDPFHVKAKLQRSHCPAGIPLEAVHVRLLSTKWTKKKKNHNSSHIEYSGSKTEQDLALQLENALPALLWYSPHAAQSGIPRHHMPKERTWSHQDRFMCYLKWATATQTHSHRC